MSSTVTETPAAHGVPAPGIATVCHKPYDGNIQENVTRFSSHFSKSGDREEDFDYKTRNEHAKDIVTNFYTLVTDFYEYGYGPSFHFAPVPDGKGFEDCIRDYEHEIAQSLNARPGMKILVS